MKTKTKMTKPWHTIEITLNTGENIALMFDTKSRADKLFQEIKSSGRYMDCWVKELQLNSGAPNAELN